MEFSDYQLNSKIRFLAKRNQMSIKQLAKSINMTEAGLYSAMKNNSIKVKTLHDISNILDTDISYFFSQMSDVNKLIEKLENNEVTIPFAEVKDGILHISNTGRLYSQSEAEFIKHIFKLNDIRVKDEIEKKRLREKNELLKTIGELNKIKINNFVYTIKFLLLETMNQTERLTDLNTFNNLKYIINLYKDDFDIETLKQIKKLTDTFEIKIGKK